MDLPCSMQEHAQEGSVLGSSVCLPRQEGIDAEDPVLGRQRRFVCSPSGSIRDSFVLAAIGEVSDGSITLTPAQLAMLIEGIDWRAPERVWKPAVAG